jgi:hypothetical protein
MKCFNAAVVNQLYFTVLCTPALDWNALLFKLNKSRFYSIYFQVQACSVFVPLVTTEWAMSGECEIE